MAVKRSDGQVHPRTRESYAVLSRLLLRSHLMESSSESRWAIGDVSSDPKLGLGSSAAASVRQPISYLHSLHL